MAAVEKDGKWYVKKKDGSLGTRGYSSQSKALNVQRTARKNVTGKGGKKKTSSTKSKGKSNKSKGSKGSSGGGKTTNSNKWTHGKIMKLHALGAAAGDRVLAYMETEDDTYLWGLTEDYAGFHATTGEPRLDHLVRGYAPTAIHKIENKIFQAAGIKQPTTNPKTVKAALKLIVYHGSGGGRAYMARDSARRAHQEYVRSEFGVDLTQWGTKAFKPMRYIKEKLIPYIIVSKILPHVNI